MPKPMSARLQGGLSRSFQSHSFVQRERNLQKAWDAVIRFSGTHLYCPAHSPPRTIRLSVHPSSIAPFACTPIPTVATEGSRTPNRSAYRRPRSGVALQLSHAPIRSYHTRSARTTFQPPIKCKNSGSCLAGRSSAFSHTPRYVSSAAMTTPSPSMDQEDDYAGHAEPFIRSTMIPEPIPFATQAHVTTKLLPSPTPASTKSESWRFPHQTSKDSKRSAEPVQSWPSTANALSTFYSSLHHALSSPSSPSSSSCSPSFRYRYHSHRQSGTLSSQSTYSLPPSSSPSFFLQSAIVNYNFLSSLQAMSDAVLVPRRDTRQLFLMQAREPKTSENLVQLLRIANDLVWLSQKAKRQRHHYLHHHQRQQVQQQDIQTSSAADESTMSGRMELELEPELDLDSYEKNVDSILAAKPLLTKAKEEFHGLRVSEYTVLLSWIGAVKSKELSLSKKKKQQDVSSQQWKEPVPSLSLSSKDVKKLLLQKSQEQKQSLPGKPSLFSSATPSTQQQQPVDYTWAIWQDFLMTGMKPDVVLYTALMDRLLKSNHLDQADEIRQHMEQQQRQQQQQYPSSSLILSPLSSLPTSGPLSSSGSEKTKRLKNEVRSRTPVKTTTVRATMPTSLLSTTTTAVAVSPNLQTFSVMMQKYVQNRDLEGVVQTYRDLVISSSRSQSKRRTGATSSVASFQQQQPRSQNDVSVTLDRAGRQQHDDDNNDEGLSLSSSATKANTVLLNQILAALISLGESRAACDIFAEMQQSSALNAVPTTIAATSTTETNYAVSSTPIHQQSSQRRSTWTHNNSGTGRKNNSNNDNTSNIVELYTSKQKPHLPPSMSPSPSSSSSLIQPDIRTYRLILQVARRERDRELERQVLLYMTLLKNNKRK